MLAANDAAQGRKCDLQGCHAENQGGSGLHQVKLDRVDQGVYRHNPKSVENIAAGQGAEAQVTMPPPFGDDTV
jgi:hypothetical protein